jgi:hypothetical protein
VGRFLTSSRAWLRHPPSEVGRSGNVEGPWSCGHERGPSRPALPSKLSTAARAEDGYKVAHVEGISKLLALYQNCRSLEDDLRRQPIAGIIGHPVERTEPRTRSIPFAGVRNPFVGIRDDVAVADLFVDGVPGRFIGAVCGRLNRSRVETA